MARYQKAVNIWALGADERAKLQIGQHVTAGAAGAQGRWAGQNTRSGVDVVAWRGNARKNPHGARGYFKHLREYAKQ